MNLVDANPYQWAIIIFMIISLTVGVLTYRLVKKSGKRYIIAGRSLPWYMVGTMFAAQAIDGNSGLGSAGLIYDFGIWAGIIIPIGVGLTQFQTGALFAKILNRMKMYTFADFYHRRYGAKMEVTSSGVMIASFIVLLMGNFAATGFVLSVVFGIDFALAISIGALIVLVYTFAGGLFASAYTDIFQIYLGIFGLWAGFIFFAGGFSGVEWQVILDAVPVSQYDFSGLTDPANGAYMNWAGLIALTVGNTIALDFMERIFAARSPKDARRGSFMGGALTLFTVIPVAGLGIVGIFLVTDVEESFTVFPILAMEHLPFWIGAIMLMSVLGASMSTANGALLAMASVCSRNLLVRNVLKKYTTKRTGLSDKSLLAVTRLFVIPIMITGVILGYLVPQPGALVILTFDIVFSGAFACLVLGMFWSKANTPAALSCIAVGLTLRILFFFIMPEEWWGFDTIIPPLVATPVFIIVALLTQNKYPGKARYSIKDYVAPEEHLEDDSVMDHWFKNEGASKNLP